MATLEKPKKSKNKRSKAKCVDPPPQISDEEDNGYGVRSVAQKISIGTAQETPRAINDFGDEVRSLASTKEEIVSQTRSAACGHEPRDVSEDTKSLTAETQSPLEEQSTATAPVVVEEEPSPSAPILAEATPNVALLPPEMLPDPIIVQYPNLKPLQQVEEKSEIIYHVPKTRTELKPFTREQLQKLYHCGELEQVQHFELEFLMNSLLETHEFDPLYAALLEYYRLQSKLTTDRHYVNRLRKEASAAQERIWITVPITKTFAGRCGDEVEVKVNVTYDIAQVDGKNLETVSRALTDLFDVISNTYTSNLIAAEITKIKIDQIIDGLIYYPFEEGADFNGPLKLRPALDADTLQCVAQLRRAISILFFFTRKLSPNKKFDTDLKLWLNELISLHLRLATKEDHWFLLLNILRCPSGIGNWATAFLQVPWPSNAVSVSSARCSEKPLPLNAPEISHCISVLKVLLMPIKKRNEYLKDFSQKEMSESVKEERWILIDSDGEDSHTSTGDCVGLRENDLVSLLNQIPFERLFTSVLNIEKFLEDYIIEADLISARQMLEAIAFFSQLVEIFGEGMLTYNEERYKQLAKRLGRLMRHTLLYVTDFYELFSLNNLSKDEQTCNRIRLEYSVLLLKTCNYIYRTRNLSTWQYFSSLPYSSMNVDTIWQIFYFLNIGFPQEFLILENDYANCFQTEDFWSKFNIANADSSAEDLYYLLQAFFEMANGRDKTKDWELIENICLHIFNLGFINKNTRDICYKTARDMLVNLTLSYEDLMSSLLLQLKVHFADAENITYLFKSLPLENWQPGMGDFEMLSNWLLHFDFKTSESMLARIVISHLNWGFDVDGRLFLPHNIHVRMACLICEALTKHAPEVIGVSSISESVRQISNLIDFTQSTKEQFSNWCWSIVSLLRLHLMDQNVESVRRTLQNATEPLMFVPELERIDLVYQGVRENRPLAMYVAMMVSLHGHSIPLICQKGFELLQKLLSDYRHAAVIRCLELIVPLFLETPETLANSESFHAILNALLNADKTYMKMAKDMMYPNTVGPVLELFDNMIHHQITSYTNYGLATPLNLINVWLNCFTTLPHWQNTNAVYLLDKVLRVAYQFTDARLQAVQYFRNYYKDCNDWKRVNKISALKTIFGTNQSRIPALSPYQLWLALVLLEIEFEAEDSHFWAEFLRQLASSDDKSNLDAVLKKTLMVGNRTLFPAHMLVIYKYGNLLATMDIRHALFPIINQKFFELYLSRVPFDFEHDRLQQVYGVSDKFYQYNVPLMKKIKTNIHAARTLYSNEATKHSNDESLSYCYRNCANMMKTYTLWLEETAINNLSKDDHNFPAQYNNEKLREILNGHTSHWTEFLHLPVIRKEQRYQADQWARKCFRLKSKIHLRTPPLAKEKTPPIERIKNNLSSYDKLCPPPVYIKPNIVLHKSVTKQTLIELEGRLERLTKTATAFHFKKSELNAIYRNYMDNVVDLYKMVPYTEIKIKGCSLLAFNHKCKCPARISTTLEMIQKNDKMEQKLEGYCEKLSQIIDEMLNKDFNEFAQCVGKMSDIVRILLTKQNLGAGDADKLRSRTGIQFFYKVIKQISNITTQFDATNKFYMQLLNDLGVFIQDNQEEEGLTILELTLKRPELLEMLSGVFVPFRTSPPHFIKMYKFLIDSHLKRCDTRVLFVLFSKFDFAIWFEMFRPKLFDINQLLQLVLRGLESWSQPSSNLLQDLFRCHLVHIFNYDFPQHYGEVVQMVLDHISDKKLMPVVLLDLLNSLLRRFDCEALTSDTSTEKLQEISVDFARRQNLFNLKAATDTVMLFARHFQKERLQHGLHGLYPKYKDYCKPLAMWFSCFGHVVVTAAICTYHELLADQICDVIFGSIVEMYSPWLIAYTEQIMQQQPAANWIRQFTDGSNGKVLLPWSEQHSSTSKTMITPFVRTLNFVLESLPISHKILTHTFGWYVHHFAVPHIEAHIYAPIHEGIASLSWELFKPKANYINMLHNSLQKFMPESHAMLGHIFIRIDWTAWFSEILPSVSASEQSALVSQLFTVFVKIAFEPSIHGHPNTSKILEDALSYPWHLVEYADLENLLKWFVSTVEPSIILRIPEESNYADRAVLDLICLACAMKPECNSQMQNNQNATAKRILYTRFMVRLQRACSAKNQKLLVSKEGKQMFNAAFEELLETLNDTLMALRTTKTIAEQRREALNFMIEIILPMQTQSEETSNLHIETILRWQEQSAQPGNILMCSVLSAIGHMKKFIAGTYILLESGIDFYFRSSETSSEWHTPSWSSLMETLHMSLDKLELMPIMRSSLFFTLHIFVLYKIKNISSIDDQLTFLQDLSQLIQSLKTNPSTEAALAVVWGGIISCGCKILTVSQGARKPLTMLARHLQLVSTQAEGWGDSLLGVIGLKKDFVSNKQKVVTRCLAIVILSLFPDLSSPAQPQLSEGYSSAVRELNMLLANKKFADIKTLIVQAISILDEYKMPELSDVPHLVCRLITLFHHNSFLTTVPEVWELDFTLP